MPQKQLTPSMTSNVRHAHVTARTWNNPPPPPPPPPLPRGILYICRQTGAEAHHSRTTGLHLSPTLSAVTLTDMIFYNTITS